jgi:hypothetical protein
MIRSTMRQLLAVVLVSTACVLPLAAVAATHGSDLVTYASLDDFLAAASGVDLAFEDFHAAHAGNSISPCYEPINDKSGEPGTSFLEPECFKAGEVVPGFSIRSDTDFNPDTGPGIYYIPAGAPGFNNADALVGAQLGQAHKVLVSFNDGPTLVAMDLYDILAGSPITLDVFGKNDSLLGSFTVQPATPSSAAFAGFSSSVPVSRVEAHSAAGVAQALSNLRFGGGAGHLDIVATPDFGALAVGTSATAELVLANTGHLALNVPPVAAPTPPFSVDDDPCSGSMLAPGTQCSITLRFAPDLERGYTQSLQIPGDGPATSDVSVVLAGSGVVPTLATTPGSIDFGAVAVGADAAEVEVVLANPTAVPLAITAIGPLAAPFIVGSGTCPAAPFDLAPGGSCNVTVGFSPDAFGHFDARLSITSNDPAAPVLLSLQGHGGFEEIFANGFEGP